MIFMYLDEKSINQVPRTGVGKVAQSAWGETSRTLEVLKTIWDALEIEFSEQARLDAQRNVIDTLRCSDDVVHTFSETSIFSTFSNPVDLYAYLKCSSAASLTP